MHYEHLATELITNIFTACTNIPDALALSATCHRYRSIFNAHKLTILASAAETQYGPLDDAIQLVTHNTSQPVHVVRSVPLSLSLLKQIVGVGRVADKWCGIYPFKRWKLDYESRRVLSSLERRRIRRAVYRLWLFGLAFHNRAHPRTTRSLKLVVQDRARLLHNWPTDALVEMADVRRVMRDVLADNVCPSNGTIARKWRKRFPDASGSGPLMFNIHLNYPPPPSPLLLPGGNAAGDGAFFQHRPPQPRTTYAWSKYNATPAHNPGAEGWGDDISHYYVVEDMLKLSPGQIVYLKEACRFKREVQTCVAHFAAGGAALLAAESPAAAVLAQDSWTADVLGCESGWFSNNGETFLETLKVVLEERGLAVEELLGEDGLGYGGDWGVVRGEE